MLAGWLLFIMQLWVPPSAHDYRAPRAETEARYQDIAADLDLVTSDPDEKPLFAGPTGRAQTALLMLAITRFESGGWRGDVDQEDEPSGDGGRAWCLAQLHAPYADDLTDRVSCFRAMLRALRDSWALCPSEGWDVARHLTGYTRGRCVEDEPEAQHRAALATRTWLAMPWLAPVN